MRRGRFRKTLEDFLNHIIRNIVPFHGPCWCSGRSVFGYLQPHRRRIEQIVMVYGIVHALGQDSNYGGQGIPRVTLIIQVQNKCLKNLPFDCFQPIASQCRLYVVLDPLCIIQNRCLLQVNRTILPHPQIQIVRQGHIGRRHHLPNIFILLLRQQSGPLCLRFCAESTFAMPFSFSIHGCSLKAVFITFLSALQFMLSDMYVYHRSTPLSEVSHCYYSYRS